MRSGCGWADAKLRRTGRFRAHHLRRKRTSLRLSEATGDLSFAVEHRFFDNRHRNYGAVHDDSERVSDVRPRQRRELVSSLRG